MNTQNNWLLCNSLIYILLFALLRKENKDIKYRAKVLIELPSSKSQFVFPFWFNMTCISIVLHSVVSVLLVRHINVLYDLQCNIML